MSLLTLYGKEIFAIFVPVFTFILNKYFKSSAKVSYGELHQFTYLINEPLKDAEGMIINETQFVHTQAFVFKNEGREPATNVEITFNFMPKYLNVWPSKHYEVKRDDGGRYFMVFDYLAPQEYIRCEVMAFNSNVPQIISVRSKEALAKQIMLYPQKVIPLIQIRFCWVLLFLGSVSLVYLVLLLLQWLLVKTG
ncbi:hypothetical protein [Escherichia coli]|uniref:hypothetical protein n=1 Tax=Escherichia coli TaxID=562 RepID=UPI0010CC5013|nr:hypothetical protein [Escherichia coli]GDB30406.1 hypothetical protein HmCmsJML243_03670 [Escherichia coli]